MRAIFRKFEPLDPLRALPGGLSWYVLVTAPRREFQISRWLEANGWPSLVPIEYRTKTVSRHMKGAGRQRKIVVPWVPRHVFVGLAGEIPWLLVMDNYHIRNVLGVGGTPISIRPGELERLQEASAALLRPKPVVPVLAGRKAKIAAGGLWHGHCVDVRKITGPWAFVIQHWFGIDRHVKMALEDLEAV